MIDDFLFSSAGRWPNRQLSVPRRIEFRNKRIGSGKRKRRAEMVKGKTKATKKMSK
jgi:hypothetical protein